MFAKIIATITILILTCGSYIYASNQLGTESFLKNLNASQNISMAIVAFLGAVGVVLLNTYCICKIWGIKSEDKEVK